MLQPIQFSETDPEKIISVFSPPNIIVPFILYTYKLIIFLPRAYLVVD